MSNQVQAEEWVENFLLDLIDQMGVDVSIDEISQEADDVLCVQLGGPDSAVVIGRDGQVLEAIQHLIVSAAVHSGLGRQRINVDVEQHRVRREVRLTEDAQNMAKEVLATGVSRDFPPLSPRERRLVHVQVALMEGVVTESIGLGDERFVRIKPAQ